MQKIVFNVKPLLLSFFAFTTLFSNTIEDDFLDILDEASTIATKTKVNIDHQPSTVTVLQQNNLQNKGFKNIFEALSTVPGFEGYITHLGWKEFAVRGVYTANAYGFDKLRLLVDGVPVNNSLYGTIYYYLDFPIDLVERIEVLRGPASVLYGTGAYSGAINIITKMSTPQNTSSTYAQLDSYGYKGTGAIVKKSFDDLTVNFDLHVQDDDKQVDDVPRREVSGDNSKPFTGKSNEKLDDYGASLLLKKENISLLTRYKSSKSGDYFGDEEVEIDPSHNSYYKNQIFTTKFTYSNNFNSLDYQFSSTLFDYKLTSDLVLYTQDFLAVDYGSVAVADARVQYYSHERTLENELLFKKSLGAHSLLLGFSQTSTKNLDDYIRSNQDDTKYPNYIQYDFVGDNHKRDTNTVYFNDLIVLNDNIDLSVGYRLDNYSDVGNQYSYNIGGIYRQSKQLIWKFSNGFSHRVPSFLELYLGKVKSDSRHGNSDLKPETINTTELSFKYSQNFHTWFKTTLFHSILENSIDYAVACEDKSGTTDASATCTDDSTFHNFDKRVITGLELDYQYKINTQNLLGINFTYIDTFARGWQPYYTNPLRENTSFADIAHDYGNIQHKYILNHLINFNTHISYIGKKTQNAKHNTLDSSTIVTETINYKISEQTQIDFSIKNLFNEKRVVPSSWAFHSKGLPREGRHYAFNISMEF